MRNRAAAAIICVLLVACSGETLYRAALRWECFRAGVEKETLTLEGLRVAYLERGPKGAEAVVLVHGFGANKETWARFIAHLPEGRRLIAPDLVGFGESTRDPALVYDIETQAKRLHALLSSIGVTAVQLAGSSMGGAIATQYALDHPEHTRSLALFAASGLVTKANTRLRQELVAAGNPLIVTSEEGYDRMLALTFVSPPRIPSIVKRHFVAQAAAFRVVSEKASFDLTHPQLDLTPRLVELRLPVLVLRGDSDRIVDASVSDAYAAGIAGAERVVIARCGHAPHFEHAETSAALYERFLRNHP